MHIASLGIDLGKKWDVSPAIRRITRAAVAWQKLGHRLASRFAPANM